MHLEIYQVNNHELEIILIILSQKEYLIIIYMDLFQVHEFIFWHIALCMPGFSI